MAPNALGQRQNALATFMTLVLVAFSSWIPVSNAASLSPRHPHGRHLQPRENIGGGVDLRVLPIGDSITFGAKSSNDNGYRKPLYEMLVKDGNKVDFVGGSSDGNFADPDHEGHRGYFIAQIAKDSGVGISAAPNVVLLHAGTNDMDRGSDFPGAPGRLKTLIDTIFASSPDAAVFVCQLIPAKGNGGVTQSRINDFNHEIPGLVEHYIKAGKKVTRVAMNESLDIYDLADDLHPNDVGYGKMANTWHEAIREAGEKGWISPPGKPVPVPSGTTGESCRSTPSWFNANIIADGAKVATGDGDFKPSWNKIGVIAEGACPRSRLHFMDLDGDGLKDYACVDPKNGATKVHRNIPDGNGKSQNIWEKPREIATGVDGRAGTGVMFADLNGDGRDDYIYVDKSGEVSAWINRGDKDGVWQWQSIGKIAGGVGATNDTLKMVDIDGDGRDDFLIVNQKTGEVRGWLNTGADIMPDYHSLGIIATGASATSADKVFMGDFTGEGRADYMLVGAGGKTNGFINRREEKTHIPRWLSTGTIAEGPDGAKQDQVRWVDLTGDGKVDYLLVDSDGKVTLWENTGTGGKYQPGDGVILCDLDGDRTMDYFWVDHNGKGYGYLNTGKGKNQWDNVGLIADGSHPRSQVRMGVLTKSKRADYIELDEKTGRGVWWENVGAAGGWKWQSRGECAAGPAQTIKNKWGWDFKAKNVRFVDLDGDGLDDYVYVGPQGATVWYKNKGTIPIEWDLPLLVADGPGVLPQEVQFADTNGDGLKDYVVVSRITGRTRSWHHLGFRDGAIRWNTPLSFADGPGPTGYSIRIAEMTGDKRADYVSINPDNGALNLWINRCWEPDHTWESVGCDSPDIEDASKSSKERWDAVGTDGAFDAMISGWKLEKEKADPLKFAPFCAHFWHLTENMNCHVRTSENGCTKYQQCQDTFRPAGYFIMNSFVSLNAVIANIYDAIDRVHNSLDSEINLISSVFQAKPPTSPDIPLALEIIGLAFAVFGAPIWNSALKGTAAFRNNPNTLGTIKDGVNGAVQGSLTIAKGRLNAGKVLSVDSALGISLSDAITTFYESLSDLTAWIFGGSEEAITVIRNLMTDGALNGKSFEPTADIEIQHAMERALYAVIIPQAWILSDEPVNPAVLPTEEKCSKDTQPPKDWVATCIDGVFYKLVAAIGQARHCVKKTCQKPPVPCNENEETCTPNDLSVPPGVETFKPGKWGNLTHHSIIRGAVNTWKSNKKQNQGSSQGGKGLFDPLADAYDLTELNRESAGIVIIPVCTEEQLRATWYKGRNSEERPNFPCP